MEYFTINRLIKTSNLLTTYLQSLPARHPSISGLKHGVMLGYPAVEFFTKYLGTQGFTQDACGAPEDDHQEDDHHIGDPELYL